ncbi:hypothetical protein BTO04_05975 [Polaribacter sp. SA4-10]|uniref:Crp/Fnr family transcriptional regulator n=1 Tax=Polaribacter sp. SA4-10 TaxID=754397 RepID=UPI000B3C8095|nr:Crp/Fnr family transcriptional regulator [Polaribacter sp. SA4-10]ARV06274.1 hypothetical protein BTO04_05975 [Polaribacter sp. SA4-10]
MQDLIKFISFFIDLDPKSEENFIDIASLKKFKKNDILVKNGKRQIDFFIIKSGIVRSYYLHNSDKTYIRNFFIKMNTSGDIGALISNNLAKLDYDCLTDCEIYVIDFKKFMLLVDENHKFAKLYANLLAKVVILFESKIYDLSVLNATERYLKLKKEIPSIENHIQQYHIASYLNITPIQLSRIRKKIYSK